MREGSKGLVSVDLETLGLYHDSVILSVGICVSPWEDTTIEKLRSQSINIKLDVKDQITNYGLKTEKSVMDWWKGQTPAAREVLQPGPYDVKLADLPDAIEHFFKGQDMKWFDLDTFDRRNFDMVKLQYVYEDALGRGRGKVPWNFSNIYEFGTALSFLGVDRYAGIRERDVPELIYHNSQDDAILDAYRLLKTLKGLGIIQ